MTSSQNKSHSVTLWTLVALIIGSTVGAGIFSLPQNIASVAGPGAMLIGWLVAGVGMLSVAFVFQILARRKPHLDSGVYSYVRAGLGDFIGFTSGWGYWLGSVMAQVGYATLFSIPWAITCRFSTPTITGPPPSPSPSCHGAFSRCSLAVLRRPRS